MEKVYLDSVATTQMRPEVITKITEVMQENYGNPSSTHSFGRSAKSLIERARKTIAKQLNVTAAEIIFTSGGTEGDNMILQGAVHGLGIETMITSKLNESIAACKYINFEIESTHDDLKLARLD